MREITWLKKDTEEKRFRFRILTSAGEFIFSAKDMESAEEWFDFFSLIIGGIRSKEIPDKPVENVIFETSASLDNSFDKHIFQLTKTSFICYKNINNRDSGLQSWRMSHQLISVKKGQGTKLEICTPSKSFQLLFDENIDRDKCFIELTNLSLNSHMQHRESSDRFLTALYAIPGNSSCAECGTSDTQPPPDWIALHFGVIVCTECAGIHRKIRRTDSISMDEKLWSSTSSSSLILDLGNTKANSFWEAHVSFDHGIPKPHKGSSKEERTRFIFAKYKQLKFADLYQGSDEVLRNALIHAIRSNDSLQILRLLYSGANPFVTFDEFQTPMQIAQEVNNSCAIELINIANLKALDGGVKFHSSEYLNHRPTWLSKVHSHQAELDDFRICLVDMELEVFNVDLDSDSMTLNSDFKLTIPYSSIILLVEVSSSNWGRVKKFTAEEWIKSFYVKLEKEEAVKGKMKNKTKNASISIKRTNTLHDSSIQSNGSIQTPWHPRTEYLMFLKQDADSEQPDVEFENQIFLLKFAAPNDEWIDCFWRLFCPASLLDIPVNKEWVSRGWLVVRFSTTGQWVGVYALLIGAMLYLISPTATLDLVPNFTAWDQPFTEGDPDKAVNLFDLRTMRGIEISSVIEPCSFPVKPRHPINVILPSVMLCINAETQLAHDAWFKLLQEFLQPSGPSLEQQVLNTNHVPLGLEKAIDYLDYYAVDDTEGLYRVCGNIRIVEILYQSIVYSPRDLDLRNYAVNFNAHDVAGAVKRFFANQPHSIFCDQFLQEWISITSHEFPDKETKINKAKQLFFLLPEINRATLKRMLMHFSGIVGNIKITKLNSTSLATSFGPSFLGSIADVKNEYLLGLARLVAFLIEEFNDIFEITKEERQKQDKLKHWVEAFKNSNREPCMLEEKREESQFYSYQISVKNQAHVPVVLINGERKTEVSAIVDSGLTSRDLIKRFHQVYFGTENSKNLVVIECLAEGCLKRPLSAGMSLLNVVKCWNMLCEENKKMARLAVMIKSEWIESLHVRVNSNTSFRLLQNKNLDSKRDPYQNTYAVGFMTDAHINKSTSHLRDKMKRMFSKQATSQPKIKDQYFDLGALHLNRSQNIVILKTTSGETVFYSKVEHLGAFFGVQSKLAELKIDGLEDLKNFAVTLFIPRSTVRTSFYENVPAKIVDPPLTDKNDAYLMTNCTLLSENGVLGPTLWFTSGKAFEEFLLELNSMWYADSVT
ncbi:ArfGAP with RhoGAP domain, ankyrin repeat and PH domain 2 [Cichlidogyrus casuarinus]|uniref:ArfGAP with RhoGAP domain, ankyrin repeat and PH domain 2 n=1 Tax=Cichlidogyrus casuarinus TaxID=1844966 RepID=A0ABD2Q7Z9_9PLAT